MACAASAGRGQAGSGRTQASARLAPPPQGARLAPSCVPGCARLPHPSHRSPPGPPAASFVPSLSLFIPTPCLLPSTFTCPSRPSWCPLRVSSKPPSAPSPWFPPVPSGPLWAPWQRGVVPSRFWHSLRGPFRPRPAGDPCVHPDGGGAGWTHAVTACV